MSKHRRLSESLRLVALITLAAASAHGLWPSATHAQGRGAEQTPRQSPVLRPSNILRDLMGVRKRQPGLPAKQLAAYGNSLIARKGFDYDFDACEIVENSQPFARVANKDGSATITYNYPLRQADGRRVTFRLVTDDFGAACGECFFSIPALRVTKHDVLAVAGGGTYMLERPASFRLEEAHLVDETFKNVSRTWQLPYQTVPVGISPDGRSLYVDFYNEYMLDELVLEISEGGRPQFRMLEDVVEREGEQIEDFPRDPRNDYLGYMRFRPGGKSYVVRFSWPCT